MDAWEILEANTTTGDAWTRLNELLTVLPGKQVYQARRVSAAPLVTVRKSLAATVHTAAIRTVTATAQPTTLSTPQTIWKSSP